MYELEANSLYERGGLDANFINLVWYIHHEIGDGTHTGKLICEDLDNDNYHIATFHYDDYQDISEYDVVFTGSLCECLGELDK